MATIKFYLKDPKAKKQSMVLLSFSYDGKRLRSSAGISIDPKIWNQKKNTLKHQSSHLEEYQHAKAIIDRVERILFGFYQSQKEKGITPQPSTLKANLEATLFEEETPKDTIKDQSVMEVYDSFIESRTGTMKPATIKRYNTLRNYIKDYQAQYGAIGSFEDFNMVFFDQFTEWLMNRPNNNAHGKVKVGMVNDSLAKYVNTLRTFLKWALERGYHANTDYQGYKIKIATKNEIVKLTASEVIQLESFDLSDKPRLEKVRDLFLFGIYTGQRWSDIEAFEAGQIEEKGGVKYWKFRATKTEKIQIVPLTGKHTGKALGILEKHNYKLPKISSQKFNLYLKEVGKLAGISEEVTIERKQGNKFIKLTKPKYDFMASHMARRTAVSTLLQLGVAPTTVMKLTGHTDLRTMLKYEDTSTDELEAALANI